MIVHSRTSRRDRNGLRWLAPAIVITGLLLGTAHAASIVTDTLVNQSARAQSNVAVTFGQVFKDGDVANGATLTATLGGRTVALQVDPKATNPDGSLRHAVLTAMAPSLAARAKLPLTLSTGPAPPAGPPIALSQLLATNYDAKVSLNIRGTTYSVNARTLLQTANGAKACRPWSKTCNVWLSGPLVSAWVVNGPVTAANGATNPNLRVYFAVRAYAGATPGTVGAVDTDIIVENTQAYTPQAQPQYTATLTSGSATYTSPALTQYTATRWHKVLWWNNAQPLVYLQQDTQYIQNSMAVSRYMDLQPSKSFLAKLRQSCAPLDHCDQTKFMGATGAQPAIGPLPRWTSVYIVDPDVRAYNWMLANTDALGAYSSHYRDEATGWPLSIQKHPYVTILGWLGANATAQGTSTTAALYRKDLLPTCVNNAVVTQCSGTSYATGNPDVWDNAHQPAAGYVAYMVTGSYYYMEELAFSASMNALWPNETYRGVSRGLIDRSYSQIRGKAWVLREMVNAAWLLPDGYPLKAEFNADVNNAIADFNAKYTNNPNASPLNLMASGVKSNHETPPWHYSFLTWSAGHAAELGFAGADAFRNWAAQFPIGLMTSWIADPTQGYCWLLASQYNVRVQDDAGNWLPSYSAVYAANFPSLAGLACNSPAMIEALGSLEKQPWQPGQMVGYANSATGFPSNLQIGLATIADTGLPNAATAWQLFDSRSVKPSGSTAYNNYPNFAVIPRTVEAGSIPPPTTITDPPTSTTDDPPTSTTDDPPSTSTPPPVPKERPPRPCTRSGCGGKTLSDASQAEPLLSVESASLSQPVASNTGAMRDGSTVAGSATATMDVVQPSTGVMRFLLRAVCTEVDAWCMRHLPRALYVSAHENARPVAGASAASMRSPAAAPVAPALSPSVSTATAFAGGLAARIERR